MIISRSFLLRIRNISDKICRGKSEHKIYVQEIFSEKRTICEMKRKNVLQLDRKQMNIWNNIRIACWTAEVKNIHSHTQNM